MNLRDLVYLVTLADHKHFGRAAAACFVSQPALSMQIKKLEDTLGVQLIERSHKQVLLTDAGQIVVVYAREILQQVDAMKAAANNAKDPFTCELKIGVIPTLAPYLLPLIMPSLNKHFPDMTIYLIEETTDNLLHKLSNAKIDGALLAYPINKQDCSFMPLFKEEFLLAASNQDSLAKRKTIKQADLHALSLLLLEDGHCLRDQALAVCHRTQAQEDKSFRATSLETLRHMVAAQAGITLMPKLACKANDGISYLSFNNPKPMRTIGLTFRSVSSKKVVLHALAEQIKKQLAKGKTVTVIK